MNKHAAIVTVALLAGCGRTGATDPSAIAAALRRRGPVALDELLAQYDAASDLAERRRLEDLIDRVAAQRYASVSRLYWYTDLAAAKEAARASGLPILSLRLLGNLDEDLSCANSRFFRVALYANADLSSYLRGHVILHWSSERPAPRVIIDMGDGRRLERTIAGNSVHYVLDAQGRPVDVIPGLRGPAAFRRELEAALPVARAVAGLDAAARTRAIVDYHQRRVGAIEEAWRQQGGGAVAATGVVDASLLAAERVTVGKTAVESPLVRLARLGPEQSSLPDESPFWIALGARRPEDARLDARSVALIHRLAPSDWSAEPRPLSGAALDGLVAAFERRLAGDTALNEYRYGLQIHRWLAGGWVPASMAELNRRIYAEPFLTPATDPWLGMATRGVFTGLPGDGIVTARAGTTTL